MLVVEKLRIAGVGGAATFTSNVTATGFFPIIGFTSKDIISEKALRFVLLGKIKR
jgi:phosphoribosylcarboxyaminoimidazole (NCAIR) mutase